jgi:hypothetical protein
MNFTLTFADAFVGALGAGALAGLVALVKHLSGLSRKIDTLLTSDIEQSEAIFIIAKIQKPQLAAHKATLEALHGDCNGNVDAAHDEIIKATKEFDGYLVRRMDRSRARSRKDDYVRA